MGFREKKSSDFQANFGVQLFRSRVTLQRDKVDRLGVNSRTFSVTREGRSRK